MNATIKNNSKMNAQKTTGKVGAKNAPKLSPKELAKITADKKAAANKVANDKIKAAKEAAKAKAAAERKEAAEKRAADKELAKAAKLSVKAAKAAKRETKAAAVNYWLTETRSKSAVKKFCQNNAAAVVPYIDAINAVYNTNFDLGAINGTLEKFALLSELNKLDLNGRVIEERADVVSINFYLTLLERKAKFTDYNGAKFQAYAAQRLAASLVSRSQSSFKKLALYAKAELSAAKYKAATDKIKAADTTALSNMEFLKFATDTFNAAK